MVQELLHVCTLLQLLHCYMGRKNAVVLVCTPYVYKRTCKCIFNKRDKVQSCSSQNRGEFWKLPVP
jgi:hypothetical protein